jgi:hypothetical protein
MPAWWWTIHAAKESRPSLGEAPHPSGVNTDESDDTGNDGDVADQPIVSAGSSTAQAESASTDQRLDGPAGDGESTDDAFSRARRSMEGRRRQSEASHDSGAADLLRAGADARDTGGGPAIAGAAETWSAWATPQGLARANA